MARKKGIGDAFPPLFFVLSGLLSQLHIRDHEGRLSHVGQNCPTRLVMGFGTLHTSPQPNFAIESKAPQYDPRLRIVEAEAVGQKKKRSTMPKNYEIYLDRKKVSWVGIEPAPSDTETSIITPLLGPSCRFLVYGEVDYIRS